MTVFFVSIPVLKTVSEFKIKINKNLGYIIGPMNQMNIFVLHLVCSHISYEYCIRILVIAFGTITVLQKRNGREES